MNGHGIAVQGLVGHVRRLAQYWDLLLTMAHRNIQVRYKQTFLGIAWAVAQPLVFMVILTVIKSVIFQQTSSEGTPHSIFLYCAMVPWMFFQNSLNLSSASVAANMNLVKKIYFPREIFPASVILASVVDFMIASGIFVGMMLFYQFPFTANLLWLPVLFAIELPTHNLQRRMVGAVGLEPTTPCLKGRYSAS